MIGRRIVTSTSMLLVALFVAIGLVEFGVRDAADIAVDVPSPSWLAPLLDGVRAAPFAAIRDADAASIVSGVVLGRTEHVQPDVESAFLESGLWHLLAASGQNVALVAACCVIGARWCRLDRRWGVLIACAAVPAYVLAVGGGASIVRAGIVGELALVAWLAGRLHDPRRLLLVAAVVICWVWPGAHRGLGMQLSFACVVALAWAVMPCAGRLRALGVPAWLAGPAAATVICGLATAPILVLRTGAAPVAGAVANLVAIPLAGAILVVGLAGVLLHAMGAELVGSSVLGVAGGGARLLEHIARRAAALPGAQVEDRILLVGIPALVLVRWGVVARIRDPVWRTRAARVAIVSGIAIVSWALVTGAAARVGVAVPGGAAVIPRRADGDVRIVVLDIGQGDATLLVGDAGAILIDTGPPGGEVVQRLRAAGVRQLDGIVLTHDSLDHRGGFDAALASFDPGWVAIPARAPGPWRRIRELSPRIVELCDGDALALGAVGIDVRNPPCDGRVRQRTSDIHNDGAMVLVVRDRNLRLLLPADAEAPVLRSLELPPVDFLRVSHHGSSDPQLEQLLDELRPEVAAISVGAGNSYGHPRSDVLRTLKSAGVRAFRTDLDGSIVLDSNGDSLRRR